MLISALEHGDRVAVLERHDGLLPARRRPANAAAGDRMPAHLHRADSRGGDPEQLLQRLADLVLVGLGVHLEGVHLGRLVGRRALLGDYWTHDHLVQRRHYLPPFFFGLGAAFFLAGLPAAFLAVLAVLFLAALARVADFLAALASTDLALFAALAVFLAAFAAAGSSGSSANGSGMTPVSAPSSTTTASAQSTSYADACEYGITSTDGRFRPLRYTASLAVAVSRSTFRPSRPRLASRPASCAVLGRRNAKRSTTWRA